VSGVTELGGPVRGRRAPSGGGVTPPHLDVKPGPVQEAQCGGTGRPHAHRHLLLQPLQAVPELGSPASGDGAGQGHGGSALAETTTDLPPLLPPLPVFLQHVVHRPAGENPGVRTGAGPAPPSTPKPPPSHLPAARRDGAGQGEA